MKIFRLCFLGALFFLVTAASVPEAAQARPSQLDRLHARAVESFRNGRFPEAYGRFVALAEAGHPASAKYALWMCEHGMELFGKDWDCAPFQIEDWAQAAGIVAPTIGPRYYITSTTPRPGTRR